MMDYWKGFMDWPIDREWKCEICGQYSGLTWGLPHAVCRCNTCHAVYSMRDDNDNVVETPILQIKHEYVDPAKKGYKQHRKPISEFTPEEWDDLKEAP
jgi:hypothetical protein